MAVMIRLTRRGRSKVPYYRVVAAPKRDRRDGNFLEILGTYDPLAAEGGVKLKLDRIEAWVAQGAIVSPAVRDLIKRAAADAA
jgi:small subunit ribosomal protein S16